jgi:hypothetical protein
MLEKKLVTLACAVGILSCGACFLPPLPQRPPPPPPLQQLDLQGIQSIRVEVTNDSESHHLDPSELAQAVANSINWRNRETGVNAHVQKEAGDGDAILAVAIVNENATSGQPAAANRDEEWFFQITATAVLTKHDGQVVWSETNGVLQFSRKFTQKDPAELWNDPIVRNWLALAVGNRVTYRMLYLH